MNANIHPRHTPAYLCSGRLVLIVMLGLLCSLALAVPVLAADIVVDMAGEDDSTCGSSGTPCRTIAYAVTTRAQSGDTVIVRAGIYTETVAMKAGVIISGTGAAVTFIDGEGIRGPMVTAGSGVTASAVLQGLTIRNGVAGEGGGVYIGDGAAPVLRDIAVLSNTANFSGGGVYVAVTATPHLERLEARYNRALSVDLYTGGGGVYAGGSLTLTDTCLISNTAGHYGGGVYQVRLTGQLTMLRGCLLQNRAAGHIASNGGGGFVEGTLVLSGTLVTDNVAARNGGGLFVSSAAVLTNATFLRNTAGQWGGGFYQSLFNDFTHITGGRFEGNRVTLTTDFSRGGAAYLSSMAMVSGTQVISNSAGARGGGLYLARESTLTNVTVMSNTAGISGVRPGYGAGVYFSDWSSLGATVTLLGGYIEDNRAIPVGNDGGGGGLYSNYGLVLTETLVQRNTAGQGGGVYVNQHATLYRPRILRNAAGTGGGLYQNVSAGRVNVVAGTFELNQASVGSGGGLYIGGSAALTQTEVLTNQSGTQGGGLFVRDIAELQDLVVSGNQAGLNGGGVYQSLTSGGVRIVGGHFDRNVASAPQSGQGGGGLRVFGDTTIAGTLITRNTSGAIGRDGGGVYAARGIHIINSVLGANTATNGAALYLEGAAGSQELLHLTIVSDTLSNGSAIYVSGGSAGITNTIVVSHTTGVFARAGAAATVNGVLWFGNTNNTGGAVSVNHAYTGEPAFAADGYHLTVASPAIDQGVDSGIPVDIDSEARPQSWLYDLGVDEYITNTQILTIAVAGTGRGVVTPTVGAYPYNYGVIATLYATPDLDTTFDGWSGDAGCTGGTVLMDMSKTCTATFTMLEPNLSMAKFITPTSDVLYNGVVTYTIVLSNTGVGRDTNVILTDTLPSGVTFKQWLTYPASGLDHSGNAITWTGAVSASTNVTFTFTVTRTGGVGDIVNTAYFSGTLQKSQATASFAIGSMICDVQNAQSYTFINQSGVVIEITTLGEELDCLYVDEIGVDHPLATGESGSSGIKTGRYWVIRGLQEDKVTDATGFTVALTLPHTGLSDPRVCRYTGGAGYGWDCAADGADGSTVWRTGITSFSEWAVGESVGPTAIALRRLTARGGLWFAGVLLALGALLTLGMVVLRLRLTTRAG